VNAGRLLREAGYDSAALRNHISPVDPDRVNVWPASPMLMRVWRPGISGVTYGRLVLVSPELMRGERRRLAKLVIHELIHVKQFRDHGYIPFMFRYMSQYLRGRIAGKGPRQAYLDIDAESEARDLTERLVKLK
jgi:hypothetical protein